MDKENLFVISNRFLAISSITHKNGSHEVYHNCSMWPQMNDPHQKKSVSQMIPLLYYQQNLIRPKVFGRLAKPEKIITVNSLPIYHLI